MGEQSSTPYDRVQRTRELKRKEMVAIRIEATKTTHIIKEHRLAELAEWVRSVNAADRV